ncbi:hypothetical protein LFYK43_00350 [Ligilactobacillus salitolerans]|uniref:Mub B2-like domain-containing protein n=1 Tax=Ligilactobacillus salitolerans TaxID=1808352 RepID=A0A401IPX0_9LACO|nr:hypothetical protein [Ligilactobacillus salitolerans]GBG93576.1 hypothetical protein LFYK43_00350 [Ligilactobacillus salitolerans]
MKKIKLGSLLLASACAIGLMSIPQGVAHAGVYTSGKSRGGYEGGAGSSGNYTVTTAGKAKLQWQTWGNGKSSKNKKLTVSASLNGWAMHIPKQSHKAFNRNLNGIYWAYLRSPNIHFGGSYSSTDNYMTWPIIDVLNGSPGVGVDTTITNRLNPNFVSYLEENGATPNDKTGQWRYKGNRVDSVDITAHPIKVSASTKSEERKVIVKVAGGNKKLYEGNKTSAPYGDKSKNGEYNYSKNIKVTVYKIKKTTTYDGYTYMSNKKDPGPHANTPTYSIESKGKKTYITTFNYDVNGPDATVKSYVPVNLNKSVGTGSPMNSAADKLLIQRYMREYTGTFKIIFPWSQKTAAPTGVAKKTANKTAKIPHVRKNHLHHLVCSI